MAANTLRALTIIATFLICSNQTHGQSSHITTSGANGTLIADFNLPKLRQAAANKQPILIQNLQLPNGQAVDLHLNPFQVVNPNAQILTATSASNSQPAQINPNDILFFRGNIPNLPGSHIFLTIGNHQSTGRIELGPGAPTYMLSSKSTDQSQLEPGNLTIFEGRYGPANFTADLLCGVTDTAPTNPLPTDLAPPPPPPAPRGGPIRGMRQAQAAVEGDYELFSLFDSEQAAIEYLIQVYAHVSDITMRDTLTRLDLVFLRVWTTPDDPWGDAVGWPQIPPEIEYDICQLMSGSKHASAGGMASGCARPSWVAYALGFFTDPTRPNVFNQDIRIAAHEFGHNLGTGHTHNYGIDTCHVPAHLARRGTIMSYCSQTFSGSTSLTDMRFHTTPQHRIDRCLDRRPNVVYDCNQNGTDDTIDITDGFSFDLNANGVPDECEDCNGNGILDDDDIASGTSFDVNTNGIPDECEPDCNENGIPDEMDIRDETSTDLYGNGIPDECETDCNENGISDYTDILADMLLDVDRNAVLDECQDCDADGIPDLVALNNANTAWAVSSEENLIRQYSWLTGVAINASEPDHLTEPRDLIITADRRVLVTSSADNRIVEFDESGTYIRDLVEAGSGGLTTPGGMLIAPDGSLLVASTGTDSVLRYDLITGTFLDEFIAPGLAGLTSPYAMATGPNGNLFITSADSQVYEYDGQTGAFIRIFITINDNGGLLGPRAILFMPNLNTCLVTGQGNDSNVLAFDPQTGAYTGIFNNGDFRGKLTGPWAMRLGPDGNVYVGASDRTENAGGGALHLTDPRIFIYDGANGNLMRTYIQGIDSLLKRTMGFDFMPDPGLDCNLNLIPDTCDLASGASQDCNENDLPDECDISSGFSVDSNANGIPDECECIVDFNGDGFVDTLDFLRFLNAFHYEQPNADLNGDGQVTALDFQMYLNLFIQGC